MLLDLFKGIINIGVPFNMIILIVLFFSVAGVITGIAKEIRKYGCHRQDIDFKRELVERGLGGEEIAWIVSAQVSDKEVAAAKGDCFVGSAPANA